jgi:hypothetical protein
MPTALTTIGSQGRIRPWFALPEFRRVFISDTIRQCVLFLGIKTGGVFRPRATAFIVSIHEHGLGFRYLVTAEHVVAKLLTSGHEIFVRSNTFDGKALEESLGSAVWHFPPEAQRRATDVAVIPIDFKPEEEFVSIPLTGDGSMFVNDVLLKEHSIGIGSEVLVVGLFRSHYGANKNVPIVRVGNIAMMRGEPVRTEYCGHTDAYLIEARSISGLSGSPVFVQAQLYETPEGTRISIPLMKDMISNKLAALPHAGDITFLLGLMHGHFDVQNLNEDVVLDSDTGSTHGIHTGIGVVIPVEKITETIFQPELADMRKKVAEELLKSGAAKADAAEVESVVSPPSNGANPTHREDFTRLVGAAARKPLQED